jgi:hypothetical protein
MKSLKTICISIRRLRYLLDRLYIDLVVTVAVEQVIEPTAEGLSVRSLRLSAAAQLHR